MGPLRRAGGRRLRADAARSTFGRVLTAVDAVALQAVLTGWVLGRRQARSRPCAKSGRPRGEGRTALAVDGKISRGARGAEGGQAKLAAVVNHADGLVLAQTQVRASADRHGDGVRRG